MAEAITQNDEQMVADWNADLANLLVFVSPRSALRLRVYIEQNMMHCTLSRVYSQACLLDSQLNPTDGCSQTIQMYLCSCWRRYLCNWPPLRSHLGISTRLRFLNPCRLLLSLNLRQRSIYELIPSGSLVLPSASFPLYSR